MILQPINKDTYGALYNWYTVNTGKLCPQDWHVPTRAEWDTLMTFLGGEGGKLKETDTIHWSSPNTKATNESGFTALPGGWRGGRGEFSAIRFIGDWWCSSEYSPTFGEHCLIRWNDSLVYHYGYYKQCGFSVRCIKDPPKK